jgi:hypothetical protein
MAGIAPGLQRANQAEHLIPVGCFEPQRVASLYGGKRIQLVCSVRLFDCYQVHVIYGLRRNFADGVCAYYPYRISDGECHALKPSRPVRHLQATRRVTGPRPRADAFWRVWC